MHPADLLEDDLARTVEFYTGVLPDEVKAIQDRRSQVVPNAFTPQTSSELNATAQDVNSAVAEKGRQCAGAHQARPLGLAFSGGGIRSATFNLGVLQGLAERGLLPFVDYLSTVSGGGYIGSWFHGVVKRMGGHPSAAESLLSPLKHSVPGIPEDDAISFLRKYSNYLAPKPGFFSADTWVIFTIWFRNVLLNQLVLLPAIASLVLVGLIAGFVQQINAGPWWPEWAPVAIGDLIFLLLVVEMSKRLSNIAQRTLEPESKSDSDRRSGKSVPPLAFFVSLVLTCCGAVAATPSRTPTSSPKFLLFLSLIVLFFCFQFFGGFRECFLYQHRKGPSREVLVFLHMIWMPLATSAISTLLISQIWIWIAAIDNRWVMLTFGPPLACGAIMAGVSLLIGLMGADYPDAAREWLASIGSNLFMISTAWILFFALIVFGPWALSYLLVEYSRTASAAIMAWGIATATGVSAGRSPETKGAKQNGGAFRSFLIGITPGLFVVGYLLFISFGIQALVRNVPSWCTEYLERPFALTSSKIELRVSDKPGNSALDIKETKVTKPNWFEAHLQDLADYDTYFRNLEADQERSQVIIELLLLGIGIALVASSRININEFSVHHFYKNRLVRCYMGASQGQKRTPNARTGFDPQDDFPVASLTPSKGYLGPFPIVNTALNLNTGSELATQERKAASFVFTPLYTGYEPGYSNEDKRKFASKEDPDFQLDGFRATSGYSSKGGPSLGTAMAISGAAANPNSGYHTSGPMAFLLTIFNVRLGWWLGNSRFAKASPTTGPRLSLKYLFMELLGQTTARTRYINLSDGGHFENLGIYELVRRRCRYIVVGDAEEDGKLTFESLGGAIRKCRADFGVEITISPEPIRLKADGLSSAHCVVGYIRYPELEQGCAAELDDGEFRNPRPGEQAQGWLLYLKSSVTGNEPADIAQYRSAHAEFPHEPTSDQFYSESQFESYRRLGLHVVRETFAEVNSNISDAHNDLRRMFQDLTRRWYAPVTVSPEAGAALTDKYSALMKRLAEDLQLQKDLGGLLTGVAATSVSNEQLPLASFEFGTELLQLMEDVVNQYGFEQSDAFTNPGVAGWVHVFQRWVHFEPFYTHVWEPAKTDYHHGFQLFVENLRTDRVTLKPPVI